MLPGCWRRWKEELPPYSLLSLVPCTRSPQPNFWSRFGGKASKKKQKHSQGVAQHSKSWQLLDRDTRGDPNLIR